MSVLSEDLVLGKEHSLDTAHEDTSLSVEVRVDLLLKGGVVSVTGTDGDGESSSLLLGLAGDVLVDGDGSVDTSALEEEGSDGSSGSLGGDKDDVDVLGGDDLGLAGSVWVSWICGKRRKRSTYVLLVDDGETVGEVKSLALGDQGGDLGPGGRLSGIRQEVHDNGTSLDSLGDVEQGLALDPSVLLGLLPGSTALSDTDNDVETVVTGVERLTVTLGSVTDHGKGVVLEVAARGGQHASSWICGARRITHSWSLSRGQSARS